MPSGKFGSVSSDGVRPAPGAELGRNVLVVFYIGEECAHCVEQLDAIEKRTDDSTKRDVEVAEIDRVNTKLTPKVTAVEAAAEGTR